MPMIPREVIEEIAARNDIESVVGAYVTLKRAGSNMVGLCPFHSERSPSFTVFPASQSFYCFGCGAGGGVITFIERIENLNFVGAVEFLANRAGIAVPQLNDPTAQGGVSRRRILDMNLAAAKFFRQCLFDPSVGGAGMRYLSEERQLSGATIKHFGLGFAPDSFGLLREELRRAGFTDEEMIAGFLCGKSQKTGHPYDYFRNRVMFPIIDTTGSVVAFGGRVMDDSKPKYLNSSDTPAFKKSKHLFALNFARSHCTEAMILCEGYMDVIALHAAGFENAVATLGTAMTPDQARIFARYTKQVIISYDSDEAGQRAANRAMQLLGEVGLEVRVLKVPNAKDPDEYIKKFGADAFRRVLNDSRTGFAYKMDNIFSKFNCELPEDKIRAGNECCRMIAEYPSAVEREVYIGQVAGMLSLPQDVLRNQVQQNLRKRTKQLREQEKREAQASIRNVGDRVNPDAFRDVQAASAEETILGLMLLRPESRAAVAKGRISLGAQDFFTAFGRRVFEAILSLENSENGFAMAMLEQMFSPEEMGRIQQMLMKRQVLEENGESVFSAAVDTLKTAKLRHADSQSQDALSAIENILARKAKK